MNRSRARTWTALVAAILVLLGTMGAAVAVVASHRSPDHAHHLDSGVTDDSVGGWSMMADRDDDRTGAGNGSMMAGRRFGAGSSMMGTGRRFMMGGQFADAWSMMSTGSPRFASMMGAGWAGSTLYRQTGAGPVDSSQARQAAQTWLTRYAPSARLGDAAPMPMGYRFLGSAKGTVVAMIMVDDDSGTVVGIVRDTAKAP